MATRIVLAAIFATAMLGGTSGQSPIQCGVTYFEPTASKNSLARIVGGTEARPNSYPWLGGVMKKISKEDVHFCGATLIRVSDTVDASDILITAAHCLDTDPTHILLGAHSMSKPRPGQQLIAIAKAVQHFGYSSAPVKDDIAVIKLQTPVNFTQTIQPACLPASLEQIPDGAPGIVAGWGLRKETDEDYPDLLQQAIVPTYNFQDCLNTLFKKLDATTQFCAGYPKGGVDTCSEDSGGPYILKNTAGKYVVQGIVSYGIGCARANRPGVYTRVSGYIPWINSQVKLLSSVRK